MNHSNRILAVAALHAAMCNLALADNGSSGDTGFLSDAKPIVDLRVRFEGVEQEGTSENASAGTVRGRLGVVTGKQWHTSLLAEGEFVTPLVGQYNSTVNGKTKYPAVSDPEAYEVNRFAVTNTHLPGTTVVLGRQAFSFDDSRFISDATWRQNGQTYDALRVTNQSIKGITLNGVHLIQTNRAVGRDSPVGRYKGDSYLLNAAWKSRAGTLSVFSYILDVEQAPTDSSRTTGTHFEGASVVRGLRFTYSASVAHQNDYADNPIEYSNGYRSIEVGGAVRAYTLITGVEQFDGNGAKGFATPFGANHKFAGWSDQLGAVPRDGLDNRYVALSYQLDPIAGLDNLTCTLKHHDFDAERLRAHYGSEWNLLLQAKLGRITSTLKYADYRADTFSRDTRKFWAQVEYVW